LFGTIEQNIFLTHTEIGFFIHRAKSVFFSYIFRLYNITEMPLMKIALFSMFLLFKN